MTTPDPNALLRLLHFPLPSAPSEGGTRALLELRDLRGLPRFPCDEGTLYACVGDAGLALKDFFRRVDAALGEAARFGLAGLLPAPRGARWIHDALRGLLERPCDAPPGWLVTTSAEEDGSPWRKRWPGRLLILSLGRPPRPMPDWFGDSFVRVLTADEVAAYHRREDEYREQTRANETLYKDRLVIADQFSSLTFDEQLRRAYGVPRNWSG
jgi:hypothetical protein